MPGSPIRQDYFETALKLKIDDEDIGAIELYMAKKQNESNANELWLYFNELVKTLFPNYRKEMKGIDWGYIYNKYSDIKYDSKEIEEEVSQLMADDDVTNKKCIYNYIFSNDKKNLTISSFTVSMKRTTYEKQHKLSNQCKEKFDIKEMEADHIDPWSEGGKT